MLNADDDFDREETMKTRERHAKSVPQDREELHYFDPAEIEVVSNPRTHSNPGWKPEKMKELREAIRKDGLTQPLQIWLIDGNKPRLIAGGRRLASILKLIEDNANCLNLATKKWDKASKVYAEVKCIITDCADDKDAARAAVLENILHEHLTDYEVLLQCETLEAAGHSRAEQAALFGKSEAWVSQSHSLLKGHPKVLEALHESTLGRTQALQFLAYPPEKTEDILDRSIAYNNMEFADKEKELLAYREKSYEQWEQHEAELCLAHETGNGNIANIRRQLTEDEKEGDAADRKLRKHRAGGKRKPRPSISNIQAAARDEAADGGANRHLPMKQVRKMADQLTGFLDSGEPLFNPDNKEEFNRREVRIIRDVLDCILARNNLKTPLDALAIQDEDLATAAK